MINPTYLKRSLRIFDLAIKCEDPQMSNLLHTISQKWLYPAIGYLTVPSTLKDRYKEMAKVILLQKKDPPYQTFNYSGGHTVKANGLGDYSLHCPYNEQTQLVASMLASNLTGHTCKCGEVLILLHP